MQSIINDGRLLMDEVIENFETRLGGLRSGRANVSMLYGVSIDYYGSATPIEQIAQISVVEGRQLVIKPFDPSALKEIEHTINNGNLGLLAQNDGTVVRINVPQLTEETRKEVSKQVGSLAEDAKVAARNVRRDLNDEIKNLEDLPEDQEKRLLDDVQKLTDDITKKIDAISKDKVKEIMTI
ncbi:ribosome recycling factor [Erysipelothrix rhusiopathiae]|uniref:Ribosome-recycling factor n=3 Tax=Bacillota TaxID=1239 RepID=E7FUI3_ERYRH|nr:ribosome recycling factor [Erysipelothrix rhusiopathiae]CAH2761872.1 ribosome recycling factor [Erysipelothrix sp. A18Y020d]AGN23831.1 ribosome recycling factor [Erysipelothrix rhusiopathiae SY1027]AMS11358.1 ribosome recycling factor [Erysipelothrix rhusiopathiae]AOO67855.1 ribosome recycling factor [Erysipelothrix rhusiopathiae]AWU41294.1 ribosome recycling factor [Erysipelothrix rhusiopathiae]